MKIQIGTSVFVLRNTYMKSCDTMILKGSPDNVGASLEVPVINGVQMRSLGDAPPVFGLTWDE